jgi:hypothetical protein
MSRLYVLLALAAIADVLTRALAPTTAVDLSPLVALVGYGAGFAILKAVLVVALIGDAELIRRIRPIALTAGFAPSIAVVAWTIGALANLTWIVSL